MTPAPSYEDKIIILKQTMQSLYTCCFFCGLITYVDLKRNSRWTNARQMVFPIIGLTITTAMLYNEMPNVFAARGKKLKLLRHKSSRYNLYVIHVFYMVKLFTSYFVVIKKSKWLPIIVHEILKINKDLKLSITPINGNRLAAVAIISTLIPMLVRKLTFPSSPSYKLEFWLILLELSIIVPVLLNAQHYQICKLLTDSFEGMNKMLNEKLTSLEITNSQKTKILSEINYAHYRLCGVIKLWNELYKYAILMEFLNNSMGVITITFHLLDFSSHTHWAKNVPNGFSRWLHIVARLYFLCYSCNSVIIKSREAINVLIKGYEFSYDKAVHKEIEMFMRRVENERVVFDICGLFYITTKTFILTLRTTTSMALILVQFNPQPSIQNMFRAQEPDNHTHLV